MKYSGRRSYAFLALAAFEKGATVKNEARFWSRELGCRERTWGRGKEKKKKERKTQNISRGLSVWESQCKHNRQLFLDSCRGMKFSAGAEIHRGKMCELLKTQFASLYAGNEKGWARDFSYIRDRINWSRPCSLQYDFINLGEISNRRLGRGNLKNFPSVVSQRSISSSRPQIHTREIFFNITLHVILKTKIKREN